MDQNVLVLKTPIIKTAITNGHQIHHPINLITPQKTTQNQTITQTHRYLINQLT